MPRWVIEQEAAAIVVYRRTDQGFVREDYEGLTAVLPLSEIETDLPLAEIYQRVEFSVEQDLESKSADSAYADC